MPVRDKSSVPWHTRALSALPQLPGTILLPEDCGWLVHTTHAPFLASSCILWSLLASGLQAGLGGDVLHLCILPMPESDICHSCAFGPNSKCQMHPLSLVAQWTQSASWKFCLLCQALAARGTTQNNVKSEPWVCVWQAHRLLGIAYCHSDTGPQCWQPTFGYIWVIFKLQLDGHEWILQLSYHIT